MLPLLVGGMVSADPNPAPPSLADGFTPDQEATSYSYYVALGGCIQNNMYGDFNSTVAENGNAKTSEWFDDNQAFGYIYPNGAKTDCKDIATKALALWGWTNSEDFLRAMKYTYSANTTSGTPSYHGTADGGTRIKNFQNAVQAQVYGGAVSAPSAAAVYDIDLNAFTQNGGACSASDLGPYDGLSSTQKAYVDAGTTSNGGSGGRSRTGTTYVKIPIVDATTGASVDHGYTYSYTVTAGVGTSSTTDLVTLYGYHATAKTATCEDLVAGIQKNAVAYSVAVQATKKGDTGNTDTCTKNPDDPSCAQTPKTTCAIDGIGWLLCPVLTAGAGLADSAYGFLADNFLSTDPSLVNTNPQATAPDGSLIGTGTYSAWKIMQSIANVAFVIVFLIVIFSQLTNVGVSQYGVKKLLPRLVVGAVLVNASFYVCQIAIDLSNILGYSMKGLLTAVATQVTASGGGAAVPTTDDSSNLVGITATVLAIGAAAWINVGALVVAIVGTVITLLTIFVLLIARKALIVLLVVIAPLAFVAFLLPNTEQYFKKWRQLFMSLLLLFPIIGVLYGACLLASAILKQVAGSNTVMQIAAYIVLVVPLLAAIPLLKGSLDGVGKVGSAIRGLGDRTRGAAGKKAGKVFDNSRLGQFKQYRSNRWAQRRAAIQGGTYQGVGGKANPLNWLAAGNRGMNRMGGRFGAKLANQGAAVADKEDAELLGNAASRLGSMTLEGRPLTGAQLVQIAKGQAVTHNSSASGRVLASASTFDEYSRRAAIERVGKTATVTQAHDLVDASSGMSVAERKALANSLAGSSAAGKAPYLGGRTLEEIAQGTATSDAAALNAIRGGKITAAALAAGDKDSVQKLVDVASATPDGSPERAALESAYDELMKPDSRLREGIVAGGDHDQAIQQILSPRAGSSGADWTRAEGWEMPPPAPGPASQPNRNGSFSDDLGRSTPNGATGDYHDRMNK